MLNVRSLMLDVGEEEIADGREATIVYDCASNPTTSRKIVIGSGCTVDIIILDCGENSHDYNLCVDLAGIDSKVSLVGMVIAKGESSKHYNITQHHLSPANASRVNFRTILEDKAQVEYRGLIRIEKNAPQTNAYQEIRNVLFSKTAKVKYRPNLEIKCSDVKCTHGATTSPPSLEQAIYLTSRGIDMQSAQTLLLKSHMSQLNRFVVRKQSISILNDIINHIMIKTL